MANGTRTAPTISDTDTFTLVSLHWLDKEGDVRSDSYQIDASLEAADYVATLALIETFAAKMVLASNASLWRVAVAAIYSGAQATSNALAASRQSADDVINVLQKTTLNVAQDIVVRAPLQAAFVGTTKEPDPTDVLLTDIETAFQALVTGFSTVSYRFTEHKDIGKRVRK